MVRALMRSIFGKNAGALLLLDQRAAHAAPAEIDGEREPGRAGADDENVTVQIGSSRDADYPGGRAAASSVNGV